MFWPATPAYARKSETGIGADQRHKRGNLRRAWKNSKKF